MRNGWKIFAAAAVGLTLSACGGESNDSQTTFGGTSGVATIETSGAAKDIGPTGVQSCLEAAGYEVVAGGDLPIVQGSKAVGVRIEGGGNIMPGNLSAAIFWYDSATKATSMQDSVKFDFRAISRVDKIVAVYDPMPSQDVMAKIDDCIT